MQENQRVESWDVLADGSCQFYSVMFAYLLPKLWEYNPFRDACRTLFGDLDEEYICFLRLRLQHFNWESEFLLSESVIKQLVEVNFRKKLMGYLRDNPHLFPEDYVREDGKRETINQHIDRMERLRTHGEEMELELISRLLNVSLSVKHENGEFIQNYNNDAHEPIILIHTYADENEKQNGRNHYHFCLDNEVVRVHRKQHSLWKYDTYYDQEASAELLETLNTKISNGEPINFAESSPLFVALYFGEHFEEDLYTDEEMKRDIASPDKIHPMFCPAVFDESTSEDEKRTPRHQHGVRQELEDVLKNRVAIMQHREAFLKLTIDERDKKHKKFVNSYQKFLSEDKHNIFIPATPVPKRAQAYARDDVSNIYPKPRTEGRAIGKVRVFLFELPVLQRMINEGSVISLVRQVSQRKIAINSRYLYDASYEIVGNISPQNVVGEMYVSCDSDSEEMVVEHLIQLAKDEANKRGGILVNLDPDGKIFQGVPFYSKNKYKNSPNKTKLDDIRKTALERKRGDEHDPEVQALTRRFAHLDSQAGEYDHSQRIPKPRRRTLFLSDAFPDAAKVDDVSIEHDDSTESVERDLIQGLSKKT